MRLGLTVWPGSFNKQVNFTGLTISKKKKKLHWFDSKQKLEIKNYFLRKLLKSIEQISFCPVLFNTNNYGR